METKIGRILKSIDESSAMYKSNQPTFTEFYKYVIKNPKAKKSYFEFSSNPIKVPSDTIIHDYNKHNIELDSWLDALANLKNIVNYAEAKKRINQSDTYLLHIVGSKDYGIVFMKSKDNKWFVNTLFTDHANSIENWIKEGAVTQSNKPTAPLGENSPISVAIYGQPNNIIKDNLENFNPNIKNYEQLTETKDKLQQAMILLNKIDSVISLDPSFFGKFGKTFGSKLDRVMNIKSPKTKLKRAIELLKNAQGSLIDEQFDDLNEMIDKFLAIQENKNMTKIGKILSYLDEKEKSNISLSDRHTSVMKDFSKIAQDELSKANLDTNDNGIDKKELEKITDQDLEENDELTPGQKSLAWEGFNDLKVRKPRLKSLADDVTDLAKETVIGTAHALTGGAFRKRRKVSESKEHDENKTMALAQYLNIDPSEIESNYDEFYTPDNTYIIYAEDEIMYAIDRMVTLDFEKYLPEIIKDLSANDFVELFCEFQDRELVVDRHRVVNYGIDHNIVDIDDIYDIINYNNSTFYIREK